MYWYSSKIKAYIQRQLTSQHPLLQGFCAEPFLPHQQKPIYDCLQGCFGKHNDDEGYTLWWSQHFHAQSVYSKWGILKGSIRILCYGKYIQQLQKVYLVFFCKVYGNRWRSTKHRRWKKIGLKCVRQIVKSNKIFFIPSVHAWIFHIGFRFIWKI